MWTTIQLTFEFHKTNTHFPSCCMQSIHLVSPSRNLNCLRPPFAKLTYMQSMIVYRSCLWVNIKLINVLGIIFVNWLRNCQKDELSFWMWEAHVDWRLRVKTCHLRKFDHSTAWTKWIGKNMQKPVIDMGWKKRGKELLEFDIEYQAISISISKPSIQFLDSSIFICAKTETEERTASLFISSINKNDRI